MEVIPRQTWPAELSRDCSSVGFARLPIEDMRFMWVVYEAPVRLGEESTLAADHLVEPVEKWVSAREPGIVNIQEDKRNRYYLLAGPSSWALLKYGLRSPTVPR